MRDPMQDFWEEQSELESRIRNGTAKCVYVDPDGTYTDWIVVVIRASTGIIYETQCAGTSCEQRKVEGYLIPVGGAHYDINARPGPLSESDLITAFHNGKRCTFGAGVLPAERYAILRQAVCQVPYWTCDRALNHARTYLIIDDSRRDEVCEGWVPVITPDGPAVLMWTNCD